jgi:hypothetical protein
MHRLKMVGLAAVGTAALLCIPSGPASAGGPLLLAPWALGHLLRAVTAPLVVAAAAVSAASYPYDQPGYSAPSSYYGPSYGAPPAYYGPPGYSGAPAYYPAPSYYPPAAGYYAPRPSYYAAPPAYYGYGRPYGRYYGPRGYDAAPRVRYSGPHGAEGWRGGHGYYRRR